MGGCMTLIHWIFVACGGFIGAIFRYHITSHFNAKTENFPIGTWLVNMTGSFAIGLPTALPIGLEWKLLFIAGGLGAFTTFSTVQKELLFMWKQQSYRMFLRYALLTYGGGLICVTIGYLLASL